MSTRCDLVFDGDAATVTLRPEREGLPPTLDSFVLDQLDAWRRDIAARADSLRVVFLRSASQKYFCVGADIAALRTMTSDTIAQWVEHGHRVFAGWEDLPLPTVARVDGYALGGGLELAMACDLILASATAQFGHPEGRLGFVTGWGGSRRLPSRVGASAAKLLLYTGRIIDAAAAERIGLVDAVAAQGDVEPLCAEFLTQLQLGSPQSAREHKRLVATWRGLSRTDSMREEAAASERCLRGADAQQRLQAFLNKKRS